LLRNVRATTSYILTPISAMQSRRCAKPYPRLSLTSAAERISCHFYRRREERIDLNSN
jgi:hypothetical protein